jgi:hypothetical protein
MKNVSLSAKKPRVVEPHRSIEEEANSIRLVFPLIFQTIFPPALLLSARSTMRKCLCHSKSCLVAKKMKIKLYEMKENLLCRFFRFAERWGLLGSDGVEGGVIVVATVVGLNYSTVLAVIG